MPLRFNHMELTLPPGDLATHRDDITRFYGELLGWTASDVPILGQVGLLLRTDAATSQFILVTEQSKHINSPGYDHLGIIYDTRSEVDAIFEDSITWERMLPKSCWLVAESGSCVGSKRPNILSGLDRSASGSGDVWVLRGYRPSAGFGARTERLTVDCGLPDDRAVAGRRPICRAVRRSPRHDPGSK